MVRVVLREMREQKERKAAKQLLYLRYQALHPALPCQEGAD